MAYTPTIEYWWLHQDRTVNDVFYPGVIRYNANRNGNRPRGIAHHIQEGWNLGSWQHFHAVRAGAHVFISRTGVIWILIDEKHGAWTNGDVKNPDAFIREMIRLYGPDPNDWTLTIEYEGFTGNLPYTEAQYQAGLWLTRQWMQKYSITDINRATIRHGQINSVDRYFCCEKPGGPFLTRMKADLAGGTSVTPSPPAFRSGDTVKTTAQLNVRKGAGTGFEVGFTLVAGATATVTKDSTGQATFAGLDYLWVFINTERGTGWVASDWLEVVKSAPAPAPAPTPAKQTVDFLVPMMVRTTPGFWDKNNNKANVITTLPAGTKGTVLEAPKEADGVTFYNIEVPGFGTGWVAKEILNAIRVSG